MVSTNEAERNITKAVSIEASAMYANQESTHRQQNQFQRSAGNSAGNSVGRMKQRPYCTHCQFNGHTKEHCYKLNGYPPGHRLYKGKNQNKSANNVTLNAAEATQKATVGTNSQAVISSPASSTNSFTTEQVNQIWNMIKQQQQGPVEAVEGQCHKAGICSLVLHSLVKHSWIVDSGATDHFICDKSLLKDVYELPKKCHISLPDGNAIVVSSAGTYELRPGLVLHDVMFASEFKYNLLSVSKLVKDTAYSVIFNKDRCLIQDSARRTVLEIGKVAGGLFQVEDQSYNKKVNSAVSSKVSAQTWHHRLGHMSFERMHTFLPKYIPSLPVKTKGIYCGICPLAKQSRLKFPLSEHLSTDIFDMIHCDVWGPFPIETMSGAQYFLTIVDDKSRCVWTYLMRRKSEVADLLIQFFAMVDTQFAKKIKVLRSDNGGEFFSAKICSFLRMKGCVHQSSCAYTPQQNGVVERKHRHILDVARALRIQANIPKSFWGDCVLTATYILNRTPTPILDGRTPSEILFGFPPSLVHMRVFGCLCYVHTLPRFRDKLDPRSSPCIFLGYPYGKKAYKVYCLTSHKVLISRDVHFYEDIFPFQLKPTAAESGSSSVVPLVTNWTITKPHPSPAAVSNNVPDEVFHDSIENANAEQLLDVATVSVEGESNSVPNTFDTQDSFSNNFDSHGGSQNIDTAIVRRSKRHVKPPGWLKDYQCNALLNTSSPHSMDKQITYEHCSSAHVHFLGLISLHKEPTNYTQASKDELWRTAMQKEIAALEHNQTWTLTHLPADKRAVDCKWVFKIKHHSDGTIERYKARLVAKGFTQVEGIDYHETFAPVVKMTTVRCVLAVAAVRKWPLYQLDVNNAFLHGHLDEDVYMKLPPGFYPQAKRDGMVCKLQRSLYGLKQASRQWFSRFSDALIEYGFVQSANDSSLFTLAQQTEFIILLVYVDDVVLTGTSSQLITHVKEFIHDKFQIKDLGYLKYFLGLEVARSRDGIFLNQRKYALDILEDANFSDCKPVRTPMESKHGLGTSSGPALSDPSVYRRLVGRLIYLTITRPDLAFPVHLLSQYMQAPTEDHMRAAHRVLRYIKSAPAQGLLFSSNSSFDLAGYCDADWASCPITRRSVSGYCMMLGSSVLSWKTKKQAVVARSSAESEYRALAGACGEVLWLVRLLGDLRVHLSPPVPVYCDNQAAIHIARNPVFHERTKHVEIDCHFVRHHVNSGFLNPIFLGTLDQPADLFTKPLSSDRLHYLSSKLGVSNFLHNPA
ncbi:unnamed protein product [Rhodiola kirilowii]